MNSKTEIDIICQSCGALMTTSHHFGTNKNGSSSSEYCQYCFKDGAFTDPGISKDEKIRKNIDIAVKMGMNEEQAHIHAYSTIPTLRRWK